mgnify:CR=1 FL=1
MNKKSNDYKLIAHFMGYNPSLGNSFDNYSNSWDWLMPVVQRCYESGAEGEHIGDITMHLTDGNIEGTYRAVVAYIEGLSVESVEPDTKAVDEAFFAGFCHALEYVKTEMLERYDYYPTRPIPRRGCVGR